MYTATFIYIRFPCNRHLHFPIHVHVYLCVHSHVIPYSCVSVMHYSYTSMFEQIDHPAKLLDYFFCSNKSNINQWYIHTHLFAYFMHLFPVDYHLFPCPYVSIFPQASACISGTCICAYSYVSIPLFICSHIFFFPVHLYFPHPHVNVSSVIFVFFLVIHIYVVIIIYFVFFQCLICFCCGFYVSCLSLSCVL